MKMTKLSRMLLLTAFLSVGSAFAQVSCTLVDRNDYPLGEAVLRTSVWSCNDGCSYTTTSIITGNDVLIIADEQTCG